MHITIIRTVAEFNALSGEWNDLLQKSASHVPFLRHEYLISWWRTLGGGEWPTGELYVVTARWTNGELCGIAPLFFTDNLDGKPALMLMGSIEISDYLDVIARKEDLAAFLDALFDHLSNTDLPGSNRLDWYNILESSPTLTILQSMAENWGWDYSQEKLQHCPYIPLPGDWETYLSTINKKQRHEIRRKIRRAESNDIPVRWYIVEDETTLDDEVEDFLALMGKDEAKQGFLTEVMRSQFRASLRAAYQAGWLQMAFLEVGGEKAAGYLNFDYGNHIWVYNSGFDSKFSSLSPGWVLLAYLLEWANNNGREAFDFMRGDEDYKYRFGGVDRFIVRAKVLKKEG